MFVEHCDITEVNHDVHGRLVVAVMGMSMSVLSVCIIWCRASMAMACNKIRWVKTRLHVPHASIDNMQEFVFV